MIYLLLSLPRTLSPTFIFVTILSNRNGSGFGCYTEIEYRNHFKKFPNSILQLCVCSPVYNHWAAIDCFYYYFTLHEKLQNMEKDVHKASTNYIHTHLLSLKTSNTSFLFTLHDHFLSHYHFVQKFPGRLLEGLHNFFSCVLGSCESIKCRFLFLSLPKCFSGPLFLGRYMPRSLPLSGI